MENCNETVSYTHLLINVFVNLFMGISLGANVLAARFYAAGKEKEMSKTVHTSITVSYTHLENAVLVDILVRPLRIGITILIASMPFIKFGVNIWSIFDIIMILSLIHILR